MALSWSLNFWIINSNPKMGYLYWFIIKDVMGLITQNNRPKVEKKTAPLRPSNSRWLGWHKMPYAADSALSLDKIRILAEPNADSAVLHTPLTPTRLCLLEKSINLINPRRLVFTLWATKCRLGFYYWTSTLSKTFDSSPITIKTRFESPIINNHKGSFHSWNLH